jgi:hypothetical protein
LLEIANNYNYLSHALIVNIKNWYRNETDLWAEFGKETPFGRKILLKAFGKDACGREHAIIRQEGCFALARGSIWEYVMT